MKTLLILFLLLSLAGCATAPVVVQERDSEKYHGKFSYAPPEQTETAPPSSVTLAVSACGFKTKGKLMWFASEQFTDLSDSVQQDMQKIILSKGFGIRGPYKSYDMIPYQDKKDIDLFVFPIIELSVKVKDQKEDLENYWAWKSPTLQTGTAEVSGGINIEIREITTKELLWTKTFPLEDFNFSYSVVIPWGTPHALNKPYNYDSILNGMAMGMEHQYPQIMDAINKLIDPEEMEALKKQAQEIKTKK